MFLMESLMFPTLPLGSHLLPTFEISLFTGFVQFLQHSESETHLIGCSIFIYDKYINTGQRPYPRRAPPCPKPTPWPTMSWEATATGRATVATGWATATGRETATGWATAWPTTGATSG